jgi:hypothetical protein
MSKGSGTKSMAIDLSGGYSDNAKLVDPLKISQKAKKKEPLKARIAKHLDYISGVVFFGAFLISKPQYLPHPLISSISKLVGLCGYLIGYFLWFLSTLCYEHHDRLENKWYGFAEFKDQFQVTSIIGLVATILCLVFPIFILPATCLFAISNILWLIGEHHRNNTPNLPGEPLSSAAKNYYFNYVRLITTASVIAAVGMTIAFFCPVIALPVMAVTTILGIGLSLIAMIFLVMKSCVKKPAEENVAISEASNHPDTANECQDELGLRIVPEITSVSCANMEVISGAILSAQNIATERDLLSPQTTPTGNNSLADQSRPLFDDRHFPNPANLGLRIAPEHSAGTPEFDTMLTFGDPSLRPG